MAKRKWLACKQCGHKMDNHWPKPFGVLSGKAKGKITACFGLRRPKQREPDGSCLCQAYQR